MMERRDFLKIPAMLGLTAAAVSLPKVEGIGTPRQQETWPPDRSVLVGRTSGSFGFIDGTTVFVDGTGYIMGYRGDDVHAPIGTIIGYRDDGNEYVEVLYDPTKFGFYYDSMKLGYRRETHQWNFEMKEESNV